MVCAAGWALSWRRGGTCSETVSSRVGERGDEIPLLDRQIPVAAAGDLQERRRLEGLQAYEVERSDHCTRVPGQKCAANFGEPWLRVRLADFTPGEIRVKIANVPSGVGPAVRVEIDQDRPPRREMDLVQAKCTMAGRGGTIRIGAGADVLDALD